MEWIFLLLAIALENCGTTLMKLSNGFTKLLPSVGVFVTYFFCFYLFSLSLRKIPVSVAYAIWCAVGVVVISIIGIFFFKENVNAVKIVSIIFIVLGVIGLRFSMAG